MNLDQQDSALLKTALDAQTPFFYWMNHDTTAIDNTQYAAIKAKFEAWAVAYAENDLYVYGQTNALSGIDSVPIPPAR